MRRALLGGAAAAAAAGGLVLAGCTGGDGGPRVRRPGQRITLSFWSWVPGIDRPVALWNRHHPEVRIKLEKVSAVGGAQYAKMHASVRSGDVPDLAQIEYAVIPSFLLDNALLDLSAYGADRRRGTFTGWQWQQSVFAGRTYAVPQDSGPMGLFWRRDLFDRWAVEPPATWDDYAAAARAVRRRGAWIETFAPANGNRFAGLAWQAGARWFRTEDDTWVVAIDDEPTRRVADFWEDLVRRKLVKTVPDRQNAWYKDIQTGDMASWIGASWGDVLLAGNAPKTAGRWRVAPLPQWHRGARAHANWGGSTTAVFRGTRYPRDALDFALWLNSDRQAVRLLIEGGYGFPSVARGYRTADLEARRDFFGGQHYGEVFAEAARGVDTSWRWGPSVDALYQRFGDAFSEAIDNGHSFRSVLRTVQAQTLRDLRDKGLKAAAG
ncbi:extracellular solute-binding protein [Streptomyces sp. B1866]|uniref:ABC transporter substrate-binding protein n=1 Tax=Streptomyces sp. B1866 TaxID=3075431 RepID=UPI002891F691|nr:extracellular solute-binding protein [Streptomyces sp. B1866]MDT3400752.1 extracellular solute-binding protein [Streptomyces sp. B1866]